MDHNSLLAEKIPRWRRLSDAEALRLRTELKRELSPGHVLAGLTITAVAQGPEHPDDILFRVECEPPVYAFVHLSWNRESLSQFPFTKLYQNLAEVAADESPDGSR